MTELKPAAKAHLEAARLAAAYDFPAPLSYCENIVPGQRQFNWMGVGAIRQQGGPWGAEPAPAKVFDNLYYLGVRTSTTWAVETPEGIVLFDSLNNETEVKTHIEGGLRKFGLDPARIRYVVMTHGHGDHYGGAKDPAGKVQGAGADGWTGMGFLVARANPVSTPERGAPPTRDMSVTEGQKLPGGITLHLVPGHTVGTVDAIIPVTDKAGSTSWRCTGGRASTASMLIRPATGSTPNRTTDSSRLRKPPARTFPSPITPRTTLRSSRWTSC